MIPNAIASAEGNIFCVVDVETSGRLCGHNEIIQIAIVPVDSEFEPDPGRRVFSCYMQPERWENWEDEAEKVHGIPKEKLEVEGLTQSRAADALQRWFDRLELPYGKRIIPLAHNWAFEKGFLQHWLGSESYDYYFHPVARDTMVMAGLLNDLCSWNGKAAPFAQSNLGFMCRRLGVINEKAHDAYYDCKATAAVYRHLLNSFGAPSKFRRP